MGNPMKIGVLALQGAFIEQVKMLRSLGVQATEVRSPADLDGLDGLIIPGGESTTIGKLAVEFGLIEPLRDFARTQPTWGTCAGMIFLASDLGQNVQPILSVMDISVDRNAFGRQINSFEADLAVSLFPDVPYHAVFIRAPAVTSVSDEVAVLGRLKDNRIVAVQQGHLLATAFHPELTDDLRFHQHFLQMIAEDHSQSIN
jgi:5'-phosphate synthase pdxT subunit